MQEKLTELQSEALAAAAEHIRGQRQKSINTKLVIASLTVILVVAIVCATVLGCTAITSQQETIREQQYALNMQYAGLLDMLYGAEITTEESTSEAYSEGGGGKEPPSPETAIFMSEGI